MRRLTNPKRLAVLGPTPSLVPGEAPKRIASRINALIALLTLRRTYDVVRSRSLARRLEALRHALVHADDCAQHVARAIARRLAEAHRPIPRIRLRRWRVKRGEDTLASRLAADYILALERLMPPHFADDG